jgi:hypothetical protein
MTNTMVVKLLYIETGQKALFQKLHVKENESLEKEET